MADIKALCDVFHDYFRIGAALSGVIYSTEQVAFIREKFGYDLSGIPDGDIAAKHFNLIVAENDTKMERIYKAENQFDFSNADKLIEFGKKNKQDIRWHTLVWHAQTPDWIFKDEAGNNVSKQILEERLKKYIYTVGERYSDDICSVDVVNECISDKKFCLRTLEDHSRWFDILGPDYVEKAFFWAKDAFPKSSLVINDYNLEVIPGKRQGMYELLQNLLRKGVPVDTVGLQMHINVENPPVKEIEETIELYGRLGLNVIVTEMDVSVYNDKDPFNDPLPKREYTRDLLDLQAQRYYDLFECFKRESEKGFLKDVVLWGVTDGMSWKNNFPVKGRTDIPLLFNSDGSPKPAFEKLIR